MRIVWDKDQILYRQSQFQHWSYQRYNYIYVYKSRDDIFPMSASDIRISTVKCFGITTSLNVESEKENGIIWIFGVEHFVLLFCYTTTTENETYCLKIILKRQWTIMPSAVLESEYFGSERQHPNIRSSPSGISWKNEYKYLK